MKLGSLQVTTKLVLEARKRRLLRPEARFKALVEPPYNNARTASINGRIDTGFDR